MLVFMPLCQQCTTAHGWLGKKWVFLKYLLPPGPFCPLFFYSQSLDCQVCGDFYWLHCQLRLSSSPGLYLGALRVGAPRSRDLVGRSPGMQSRPQSRAQAGSPRGQKYMGLWRTRLQRNHLGGLIMATVIGSLATNVTDIAVY